MAIENTYEANAQRRLALQSEINQDKVRIDYSVFKKTDIEKAELKKLKAQHKKLTTG